MSHFKKTKNRLEKMRGIFFQIGLIISGGLVLLAFEWMTPIGNYELPDTNVIYEEEWELPPVLPEKEIVKPMVKKTTKEVNKEILEIVDKINEVILEQLPEPTPEPEFVPETWEPVAETVEPEIFLIVEEMPEFVGGDRARIQYLKDNVKYPGKDRARGIEGTVYLKFVVNKKGEIKKVKVLKGVSETIDQEAVRVVKAMPNWKPGKQRGKNVNVSYTFRIAFILS